MSNESEPVSASELPVAYPQVRDCVLTCVYHEAADIASRVVERASPQGTDRDERIDDVITSPFLGFPIMLLLLGTVLWITIAGANYPSQVLATVLFRVEEHIGTAIQTLGAPEWLRGFLVLGVYRGLAWVVSVMLPPMAIFFPLFTLLEDLGYLPRVAFNLDRVFQAVGAHGKQALTMTMGLGCNAAAVVSTRIIESPRERLIAILTNNFVPCNGRFPTLIAMASLLTASGLGAAMGSFFAAGVVASAMVLGVLVTLVVSWMLSRTALRGVPSRFALELPPYRKPQPLRIVARSILDRVVAVLYRAVIVAAPAGGITWILANTHIGGLSLLAWMAGWLQPVGQALGLDGVILVAFILGLPANEIVMPIMLMGYLSEGALLEASGPHTLRMLLIEHQGWTWLTIANLMLFSLLHYPCGTTLWTIYRETLSVKWTAVATLLPLGIAMGVTFLVATGARMLGLA